MALARYKDLFIDGIQFAFDLNPHYNPIPREQIRSVIDANCAPARAPLFKSSAKLIQELGDVLIQNFGGPASVSLNCINVSQAFMHLWSQSRDTQGFPLAITIGNVYYGDRSLFPVTRDGLRLLSARGKQLDENLHFHAWLSLNT